MPVGMTPPVPATLLATSGRHQSLAGDDQRLPGGRRYLRYRRGQPERHGGADAAVPALDRVSARRPGHGRVQRRRRCDTDPARDGDIRTHPPAPAPTCSSRQQDGYFAGQVTANRTAAVVLKATFDPGWHVTVDGPGDAVHGRPRVRRRHGRLRARTPWSFSTSGTRTTAAPRHRRLDTDRAGARTVALAQEGEAAGQAARGPSRPEDGVKRLLEVSILMPCLNEAETIGRCVDRARESIARDGSQSGGARRG